MTQGTLPAQLSETGDQASSSISFGPTVTIFFSDIRGFTDYTDAHGDAEAYRMLQHHNELVKEQIALYHGHIVKTLGDSYMVSFDAARNAITCAVAIQRQLAVYNSTQQGPKIEIGIGINMGEPIREGDDLFGSSVNLASRICAVTGAGRILVSEAVRQVVNRMDTGDYVDRGYFEIKGFQEPQHLYEVDWSGVGAVRATQVAPPSATPPYLASAPLAASGHSKAMLLGGAGALLALLGVVGGVLWTRSSTQAEPAPPTPLPIVRVRDGVGEALTEAAPTVVSAVAAKVAAGEGPLAGQRLAGNQAPGPRGAAGLGGAPPSGAEKPGAGAPPPAVGQPNRVEAVTDPARALFRERQSGTGRVPLPGGDMFQFPWESFYADGGLVMRIMGPYPDIARGPMLGASVLSVREIQGDMAVEASARITQSPGQGRIGLVYDQGQEDYLQFSLTPADGGFTLQHGRIGPSRRMLASGRAEATRPSDQAHALRLELRGDLLRVQVNGHEVSAVPRPPLPRSGGLIGLHAALIGAPDDGNLEVRWDDLRVIPLS